jgi:hypothetical protein
MSSKKDEALAGEKDDSGEKGASLAGEEDDSGEKGDTLTASLAELAIDTKPITDDETFVSIDVEAAAIGKTHAYCDRAPCWVAIVDSEGNELLNLVIDVPNLVSPLTKVTGVTAAEIHDGVPLDDALKQVHDLLCGLSTNVTVVGQSVQGDIDWLQLEMGVHYTRVMDLSEAFKSWNSKYQNYNFYSLGKEAYALLGVRMHGEAKHSPVVDAKISMRLYNEHVANPDKLKAAKSKLDTMTRRKQFPRELMAAFMSNRTIDGCCGYGFNPDKCICGAPTLRSDP